MLFKTTEVNIQLMKMLQKRAERSAFCHLGESVHILREAFAAIAKLTIRPGNIGMRVVDITREKHTRMYLTPVTTHLLAVLSASIEVGHLVRAKHIVHVLRQFGFEWRHHAELLAHKNSGQQLMCSREHHCLLLEVLDVGTLSEELWHVVYAMAGLLAEEVAGAWEDGGAHEDRHVRKG